MAADTFTTLTHRILSDVPMAGILQARTWVKQAFRTIRDRWCWSWLARHEQFLFEARKAAGTVSVTRGSASVVGTGTSFDDDDIGRQFRVLQTPVRTIVARSSQILTLDLAYGGTTDASASYEVWDAYQVVPADFERFISVKDIPNNLSLDFWTGHPEEIDIIDAQRSVSGTPYYIIPTSYTPSAISSIDPPRPRYEFWPNRITQYTYPYLYAIRLGDLDDSGVSIPAQLDGEVLFHKAMELCSLWPGPSRERPNPSFSEAARKYHRMLYEDRMEEMISKDDEIWQQSMLPRLNLSRGPYWDANWLQNHAPVPPWYNLLAS